MFFPKSGTVFHWRLFRTYISLFKEGYKLYYRHTVAHSVLMKISVSPTTVSIILSIPLQMQPTVYEHRNYAEERSFSLRVHFTKTEPIITRSYPRIFMTSPQRRYTLHRHTSRTAWRHQNTCSVWKKLHYRHVLEMIVLVNYTEVSATS